MKRLPILATGLFLAGLGGLVAAPPDERTATEKAKAAVTSGDVTYGRIKELTAGQKVVIDVDNAIDKTFDLNDKDLSVKMGKGLKVGDPVKVNEHSVAGKTKSVQITKHSGGGVAHGDKDPAAKKP